MSKMRKFALGTLLVGTMAMLGSACVVRARPVAPVIGTSYYTPRYYNGYVVYYDSVGRPMYYNGGVRYYVPTTYASYALLTNHYRVHRLHYNRWYRARGIRYRTYRRRSVRRRGVRRRGVRTRRVRRGVRTRRVRKVRRVRRRR